MKRIYFFMLGIRWVEFSDSIHDGEFLKLMSESVNKRFDLNFHEQTHRVQTRVSHLCT